MPYEDDRAGLDALITITGQRLVEEFRRQMSPPTDKPLPLPPFVQNPAGTPRKLIVAIDGSSIYSTIPGALPCTEVGVVSLGLLIIDLNKLNNLPRLPQSGATNPRHLRQTEQTESLAVALPGRNSAKADGTTPKIWFRQILNTELGQTDFGGENLAETLYELIHRGDNPKIGYCPNELCKAPNLDLPKPNTTQQCPQCNKDIFTTDGLRIHEDFRENASVTECHSRVMNILEMLTLINILRYLASSEKGLRVIANTAFIMDGPLAAFGTIAVLARAIKNQLNEIQNILDKQRPGDHLLILSGVKTGTFVDHAAELDHAPQPDKRIPINSHWLPNDEYIRTHIVAKNDSNSHPWGRDTYYGRPLIVKTSGGQRLVLNIAQPESKSDAVLTDQPSPLALADAIATINPLGMDPNQLMPLRRVHSHAAIPLRAGTDLIESLAP